MCGNGSTVTVFFEPTATDLPEVAVYDSCDKGVMDKGLSTNTKKCFFGSKRSVWTMKNQNHEYRLNQFGR